MNDAFIFDAVRTPRGKGRKDGALHETSALALATQVLHALRERNRLEPGRVEDVILGCATPVGEQGADIARTAVLAADFGESTAGVQVNRFCASGLEACNIAAAKVIAGECEMAIGGGVESMSRVTMGSDGGALASDPSVAFKSYIAGQGTGADLLATLHGYSRADVDGYAVLSQQRAAKAWDEGRFARSIVPVRDVLGLVVLARDEHLRPTTTLDTLAALKPAFTQMGELAFDAVAIQRYPQVERIEHVHHAGNSSGIVDGAAGVLIGSRAAGSALGLKPRARILGMASIGSEPSIMLTGPALVAQKLLKRLRMSPRDIDLYEVNEAFASVVLRMMQALDIPIERMNVNGGAIAMGHPLGATGAMLLGTALDELERSGQRTALVTLCVGGGMGTATVIEKGLTVASDFKELRFTVDADGIATALIDTPERSVNALTEGLQHDLPRLAARLRDDDAIKGLVIGSAKDTGFCIGADLGELGRTTFALHERSDEAAWKAAFELLVSLHGNLRQLETLGKPVVAALEGTALGGGLELALACHHRVAADSPKTRFGMPETGVGLIPGGGGTQRLPRLVGIAKALPVMLEGKPMDAQAALTLGLVDAVVPAGETLAAAKTWILNGGKAVQPWDTKDFAIPGGGPYAPAVAQLFMVGNAMVRKGTYGNYPAQRAILACVFEGLQVPIDNGLRIEARHFLKTLASWQARAMTRTLFHSMQALAKGDARPAGVPPSRINKVAVLGAGMMGAGIAYVQAQAGIETVLIDRTQEAADKGKAHSRKLLDKALSRGKSTPEKAEALLARIHPTTDFEAVRGCDLVIEAVFEDREVKADVTRRAEVLLGDDAVFGSNTSTLPITSLAHASSRPANFIGVHFFSPVDRMGLVEVIVGAKTSPATLACTIDYIVRIRKTPIVVGDRRNFYTGQVFGTYVDEGIAMLLEGIAPAIIDNLGRATGMPRGPLELYDDVSLDTPHHAAVQAKKDLGDAYQPRISDPVLEAMVLTHGRLGRKNGKGFYDHPEGGAPKRLWPGLSVFAKASVTDGSDLALQEELKHRFLFVQALEVVRCIEAGVIDDPRGCDVGALLGWGFPAWTGGPLGLIDGIGAARFVELCDALAAKHGARSEPPSLLRTMAREGRSFYPADTSVAA